MRKSIKKIAASVLAATMVLGTFTSAFAVDGEGETPEVVQFTDADVEDGKVHYTLAGGVNDWDPINTANEMQPTIWDGVYSMTLDLPAFDEAAEWNSRFKICQINDVTVTNGWLGSLCLGTNVYDDNQTMFRVENAEAIEGAVVYFDSATGAVVILKDGAAVDYKFSWVGYEAEAGYTDIENFATCGITWPAEKLKVDTTPDIKAGYDALLAKVTGTDLQDESLYADGAVKYVVAGGSTPFAWGTTASVNEMKESEIKGVYTFKMTVPAYDEENEWKNRFKILRLDDITCTNGWLGSLCLGTDIYDDNQTTFRVECAEETELTIYFQPSTGAVVMYDAAGNEVDYKFSWVGFDNEVQYTTVSGFATCGYTWPADKLKTDETPDMAALYAALVKTIKEGPQEEQPTPEGPATEAPTTAAPTTAAPTTATNQSTKTGDAAPVALLVVLVAAVAVVTVVAKKKEA